MSLKVFFQLFILVLSQFAFSSENVRTQSVDCSGATFWLKSTSVESTPYILEVSLSDSEEVEKIPVVSLTSVNGNISTYFFSRDGKVGYSVSVTEKNNKLQIQNVSKTSENGIISQLCVD